ncbi:hypothetical protein MHYP_G00256140 [Metynnis hypsauchen]
MARQVSHNSSAEANIALTKSSHYTRQEENTEAVGNCPQNWSKMEGSRGSIRVKPSRSSRRAKNTTLMTLEE